MSDVLTTRAAHPDSPFDALVFDLGGVVVAHDNAMIYERLASRCSGRWTAAQVQALIRNAKWGTGAAPISDLHGQLRAKGGYQAEWGSFMEDWSSHFVLDHSMLRFLQSLGQYNRVLLFSNTNKEHWDWLVHASAGVLDSFEHYLSHEIGRAKPSIEAFHHVAEAAGLDPGQSIFFDDMAENVEGARLAGFQAEVFRDEASLRSLLRAKGVRLS